MIVTDIENNYSDTLYETGGYDIQIIKTDSNEEGFYLAKKFVLGDEYTDNTYFQSIILCHFDIDGT